MLRKLIDAILRADQTAVAELLADFPALARERLPAGATRGAEAAFYLPTVERYLWAGDTALHVAAAAYLSGIVGDLLAAGADVDAVNRLGARPLHAAAVGNPNSSHWNPAAQCETIELLVKAGADPNAHDKLGATPLHRAVRTRCSAAVETLLALGADPTRRNRRGSTPLRLANETTGRGGSGTPAAKAEQQRILRLLTPTDRGAAR